MESRVWHPASLFFVLSLQFTVLCILNPIPSTENLNLTPSYAIPKRGGHSQYVLSLKFFFSWFTTEMQEVRGWCGSGGNEIGGDGYGWGYGLGWAGVG